MPVLTYNPTSIQEICDPLLDTAGIRLVIKREDMNHPFISGNKWWKLVYNLEEARRQGKKTLLTFGGAFSNHIYATAAAAAESGFNSIGIIRGEESAVLNATLTFAVSRGMKLHYMDRTSYKKKNDAPLFQTLQEKFGDFYLIPEGGTNALAIDGCKAFAQGLTEIDFNFLGLPVGTGGTMTGMLKATGANSEVLGFSSLKGGDFLQGEVAALGGAGIQGKRWKIITDYHFGGYGKTKPELLAFIQAFEKRHGIMLEQVYTGKMMFGIFDLVKKNYFPRGSTILVIHTGGLQGKLKA